MWLRLGHGTFDKLYRDTTLLMFVYLKDYIENKLIESKNFQKV